MKLTLLLLVIFVVSSYGTQIAPIDNNKFYFDGEALPGSFADKIKATKCLTNAGLEIKDIVQLYQDFIHFRVTDGFQTIVALIKRLKPILDNCGVFFCDGPSIQQCEEETGEECERSGLKIYKKCKEGYRNVGPILCRPACPEGFTNFSVTCIKPKGYFNGLGYPLWDKHKCNKEHPQGCKNWGLAYFPKCKEGFHYRTSYWCTPDCPKGFPSLGLSCLKPAKGYFRTKPSYWITVGLKCLSNSFDFSEETCDESFANFYILREEIDQIIQLAEQDPTVLNADFINKVDESLERYYHLQTQCNNGEYELPQYIE